MRRFQVLLLLRVLVGRPVLFLVTAMERTPTVGVPPTAQPADAARTKAMLKRIREAVKSEDDTQLVAISEADIKSAFAVAARGLPIRGKAQISPESASINISTGLPRIPLDGWLNVGITVLRAEGRLPLASVRVGPYRQPPGQPMPALGLALDIALGDGLGHVALNSIDRVTMRPDQISLGFTISADDKEAMLRQPRIGSVKGFLSTMRTMRAGTIWRLMRPRPKEIFREADRSHPTFDLGISRHLIAR